MEKELKRLLQEVEKCANEIIRENDELHEELENHQCDCGTHEAMAELQYKYAKLLENYNAAKETCDKCNKEHKEDINKELFTARDTLAKLMIEVNDLKKENEILNRVNDKLKTENEHLNRIIKGVPSKFKYVLEKDLFDKIERILGI